MSYPCLSDQEQASTKRQIFSGHGAEPAAGVADQASQPV